MESIVKWAGLAVTLSAVAAYGLFIQIDWPHRPLTEVDRQQAQGDFIELDQGRLHYRWDGPTKGPVVVMVHGFSTPLFIFEQNVAALADAGYRVLRYDHLVGAGQTAQDGPIQRISMTRRSSGFSMASA